MPFTANWKPVTDATGVYSFETDGNVWESKGTLWTEDGSINLIPNSANRAVLSSYGGSLHYLFQDDGGINPAANIGLSLPQGEAVLLVNLDQIKYLKIAQQEEPTFFTIQFFNARG